jgi:CheY-like chemotaxis protein
MMSASGNGNGKQRSENGESVWITGVSPGDPVIGAAARSLETRLAAVHHYLPLAAERADEDEEYIHQLRVGTRRARAAMKLYRDVLPRRDAGMIKIDLKQIGRAAGDARDYDVLISRLFANDCPPAAERFAQTLRARRRKAQTLIVAVHRDLAQHGDFERDVARMLEHLQTHQQPAAERDDAFFGQWSRWSLRPVVKKFFQAEPVDWTDVSALHKFRIRGKSLRYTMELLGPTFSEEFRNELYPVIERVQKLLGKINDHATTLTRFGDWFDEVKDSAHRKYLLMLLADEHLRFEQSREAFVSWWRPRREDVRTCFADMIASPPAGNGAAGGTVKGLNVLFAEDALVHQTLAIALLTKNNHRVTLAANGKEAVELFGSRDFDVVLMDIEMPEMDGLEATRIIRRQETQPGHRVPIFAVTSETQSGMRDKCLAAGMDGYLPKPLRAEALREVVDCVLHGPISSLSGA